MPKGPWRTVDQLELATLLYVEWSNTRRLHAELDLNTPTETEEQYYRQPDRKYRTQHQPDLMQKAGRFSRFLRSPNAIFEYLQIFHIRSSTTPKEHSTPASPASA